MELTARRTDRRPRRILAGTDPGPGAFQFLPGPNFQEMVGQKPALAAATKPDITKPDVTKRCCLILVVAAVELGVRLQPADAGDEKESQRVGSATAHELPAGIRKVRENQHADSHRCRNESAGYRKDESEPVPPHKPRLIIQLRLQNLGMKKEPLYCPFFRREGSEMFTWSEWIA